jgi:hypothetical protein
VEWNNSNILRDVAKDIAALKKSDSGDVLDYYRRIVGQLLICRLTGGVK